MEESKSSTSNTNKENRNEISLMLEEMGLAHVIEGLELRNDECKFKGQSKSGQHLTKINLSKLFQKIEKETCPPMTLNEMILQHTACNTYTFGIPQLDEALNGGILNHEITQIHGCSLSGKTSLCIRFMLEMIHNNSQIIFFPTGYQFSYKIIFQRLYKLFLKKGKKPEKIEKSLMGKANQIFSKIRFPNKNISSVEELLGSLAGVIEAVKNNPKHAIKFVIIDSLSSLFSALRNKTNYFTKSLEFLKLFQELTNKYSIGVIYTSNCKNGRPEEPIIKKPCDMFAQTSIFLKKAQDTYTAQILNSINGVNNNLPVEISSQQLFL